MLAEVKLCPDCGSYYDARSLQCPCEQIKQANDEAKKLRMAVQLLLDQVDYTAGACAVNEPVGGVLDKRIIVIARTALLTV